MPETKARIVAAFNDILRDGGSCDVVSMDGETLVDDNVGVFVRIHFYFADGGHLAIDTQEIKLPFLAH